MSEYHFGIGPGHLPKKAGRIARQHEARLVNYVEPNGDRRHWFSCRNCGEPHDSTVRRKVMAELTEAGVI